jgi:nudix-type nucleoside diphosphatase (YffH/AdpP family)
MSVEITAVEDRYQGWSRIMLVTLRMPDGRQIKREIEEHGMAACVLPFDPARRTALLVRQPRAPVLYAARQGETIEAIAGMIEEDDPALCARREAEEEAGVTLDTLDFVATVWTMPGVSTERMTLYLAPYDGSRALRSTKNLQDDDEDAVPFEIDLARLAAMADAGAIEDMKTLLLVQTLRLRRHGLFAPA